MGEELLVYGSYGYTGALVSRAAVDRGLSPILAGRRPDRVERQAAGLGTDHQVFTLDHPSVVEDQVAGVDAVLNCAGPFVRTAEPLRTACLRAGVDYLDVAGSIDVLEAAAERDREAEKAGVALLPGVGFDVVPTDCLAAHLESRLPSATDLALAIDGLGTFSPGTLESVIEALPRAGAVREEGTIREVPAAWRVREFDFDGEPKRAVTIPWGDVSTAYYTTGIPNVAVYATVPDAVVEVMRRTRPLLRVLGRPSLRSLLQGVVDRVVTGPTAEERARSTTRVYGEVTDDDGNRAAARLRTPDTYALTAETAVEAARRTLSGEVSPGFQTPGSAFGPDFVLEFEGVERTDEAPTRGVDAGRAFRG